MFYNTTLIDLIYKNLDFQGFKWVLKAISREPSLKIYDVIKIQQDLVVGTDGHRLHLYYTKEEHPCGVFKVLVRQRSKLILEKVSDINFPDWEHLLPKKEEIEKELVISRINSQGYTELVRQMNPDTTLDFNYFMDLDDSMTKVSATKDLLTGTNGILFEDLSQTKKALIMPMRI
jgi:hypothetical protein